MKRIEENKVALSAALGVVLLLCCDTLPALAEDVVVQNDSIVDFGEAVIVGNFSPGEEAGVVLTSPCDGTIIAVEILWLEGVAGHGQSLEQAIRIYDEGSFPTPGPVLALLEGPVMTPGYWNRFEYLDEAQTIPLSVPVTTGQNLYVALEFYNQTDVGLPEGGPSVVRDQDGCQAGRNMLYAIPGGYLDFCLLLVGDLGIRAVVECPGVTGACCHATGVCANGLEEQDCGAFGDTWHEGLNCGEITCAPRGACCRMGGCVQLTYQADCEGPLAGVYAGHGTNCSDDVCVAGACCDTLGDCTEVFEVQCGGIFNGPGTSCTPNPCEQPLGACCFGTFCQPDQTEDDCTGAVGEWVGPFTDCGPPNPCEQPYCATLPDSAQCLGDSDGNGQVNTSDRGLVQAAFGMTDQDSLCKYDINCDGTINTLDTGLVEAAYGDCAASTLQPCWMD
jgi:hypothetical protein